MTLAKGPVNEKDGKLALQSLQQEDDLTSLFFHLMHLTRPQRTRLVMLAGKEISSYDYFADQDGHVFGEQ